MALFNQLFPLWALLLAAAAWIFSGPFSQLAGAVTPLLTAVMFLMGLTLGREDFIRIARNPRAVLAGVALQFLLMPVLALGLALGLGLPKELTVGMVLVGSCAGGTASNVISYLARGDVALSVTLTMSSTLIGVVATPLLCTFYLAQTVSVDTAGMLLSIVQIVFLPVLAGVLIQGFMPDRVAQLEPWLPSLAILFILLIIAIVVALNATRLAQTGLITLVAVMLHNSLGLAGGFLAGRLLGFDVKQSRTLAIEVGMQNSGLGVALALQHFSAAAALPGALFSVWHNISGSLLASIWGRRK